jgi:hypothetical protein
MATTAFIRSIRRDLMAPAPAESSAPPIGWGSRVAADPALATPVRLALRRIVEPVDHKLTVAADRTYCAVRAIGQRRGAKTVMMSIVDGEVITTAAVRIPAPGPPRPAPS